MKLDHIVILVSSLTQSLPFYEALLPLLGYAKSRDHVYAHTLNPALDIRQAADTDHGYRRHAPGLNHMGFEARSSEHLDEVLSAMQAAGFAVPAVQQFDDGVAVFLRDPDGMRLEIGVYTET